MSTSSPKRILRCLRPHLPLPHGVTELEDLPEEIIHSNPVYFCKFGGMHAVVKYFENARALRKEVFCHRFLTKAGVPVPRLLSYGTDANPFLVLERVGWEPLAGEDAVTRAMDAARVHAISLGERGLCEVLPRRSTAERLTSICRGQQTLQVNPLTSEVEIEYSHTLINAFRCLERTPWDECFCFGDFFANNALKSDGRIYYVDFERATVSCPFVDIGCLVIEHPERYLEITTCYEQLLFSLLPPTYTEATGMPNQTDIRTLIDIGVCEQALTDAAFLSDRSIRKTREQAYCDRLAIDKLHTVSFLFDLLKGRVS